MTHIRIKRVSEGVFFKIKTIGKKLPVVSFIYGHPSNTPYNAGSFTFTSTSQKPIVWENGSRNYYRTSEIPNGIPFGIKVSGVSLAYGPACSDAFLEYTLDNFLRIGTRGTLYSSIQYFVIAYIEGETDAVETPIFRIEDDAEYRAYKTPDNHYFILDENYVSAKWIEESELAEYGYSTTKTAETVTAYLSTNKSPINITMSYYYPVYDDTGTQINIKPEKSYLPKKYILSDESEVEIPSADATKTYFDMTSNQSPALSVYHTLTNNINNVVNLVYEIRPANLITAWVSEDKTSQTVGPWSVQFLYDENGNRISLPQGLCVVAYYYVNGEKIYNNNIYVRMSDSGGRLRVGAKADIVIEKVEYSVQPVPTM